MSAPLLAATAGLLAVVGCWEAIGVAQEQRFARRLIGVALPLREAGRRGYEPTTAERRRLAAVGAATVFAAGWLVAGPLPAVAGAVGLPLFVGRAIAARRARWRRDLDAGAPAAARAIADALTGGHSVRSAVAEASSSGSVPGAAGGELLACARALALGEATETALEATRQRACSPAWNAIVAAILLQRHTGGDLARLLRGVAAAAQERARIDADARGLTAQARFTARLVAGMPVVAAGLSELADPGSLASLLASPLSLALAIPGIALLACSMLAVGRIARIEA